MSYVPNTPDDRQAMLKAASTTLIAERGVRVISDYLPATVSRTDEYERIFELERKLGSCSEFAAVARYTQEKHPEAFGKAAAQIGQQQPGLLNSFLGKAAMAAAAAALASHFIKMDRKTPK